MDRVFQRIGKQYAQILVGYHNKGRKRALDLHINVIFLCPTNKGRQNQIRRFIFTIALYFLRLDLLADSGYVLLCLFLLAVFNAGGYILQMMPQVMPVLASQRL